VRMRTLKAKGWYSLAGLLSHIRTRQQTFTVEWDSLREGDFTAIPGEFMRQPCRLSHWCFTKAMHTDWHHWDHWALQHDDRCPHRPCSACGGKVCEWEETCRES
jgi:hypothetical protein